MAQAFDSLDKEHTLLDLFNTEVKNNAINIFDELSKNVKIQIKTPVGITEEKEIQSTIMQGETPSSIMCTTTIGKIEKDCTLKPYSYKGSVDIPKLSFVDDILDINECGEDTANMNKYTNSELSKRKLQLGFDKCVRLHVTSKKRSKNETNKLQKKM